MNRRFEEVTSAEVSRLAAGGDGLAILPVAAIEQHGAHLPLGTDAIIADGMVETLLPLLPENWPVTVLPVLRLGRSIEHSDCDGTLDLGWETMTRMLIETGEGLARAGFRRLAILSAHGGNTPAMETAALELRRHRSMLVGTASWQRFGVPEGLLPPAEVASGIHGGAVETALMLHFRPDLVRLDATSRRESLHDELARSARRLTAHGRLGFAWMARDLNPVGTVGDARLATAAIGAAIARHQAEGARDYCRDLLDFDLFRLA